MKRSVCLRSTLRQPVRTIGITLLCAIAAFAFLYQALQYAVLEDAVDDIAAYYRPIGYLDTGYSLTGGGGIVTDVGALNDVLKDDPYIQYLNNSRATSGVFRELYTADVRGESPQVSSLYVTGTVLSTRLQVNPGGSLQETRFRENGAFLQYSHAVFVSIRPEQYLATLPEYQKADLLTLAFYAKELEPCQALLDNLATGETYLFHLQTNQKIVGEADQFMYRLLPQDTSGALLLPVGAKSTAELLAFLPKETAEDIELLNENHHAAPVITTGDMETSPWMQAYYKLVGGRLLTHEDDASRNPVCVIRQELASIRDVEIGDTIPITLRDLASWETWCGQAGGYIVPENEPLSWKEAATTELELTVVGIVASQHVYQGAGINFSTVFIPDSLLSEEWSSIYQNDRCSFLLRSPEDTAAFLEGVQPVLDQLEIPYPISFEENGWGGFQMAASPMERASRFNVALFGGISLLMLGMSVLLYLAPRRREFGLQRALGVPRKAAIWSTLVPMALLGMFGIGVGAALAYRRGMGKAQSTLTSLAVEHPLAIRFGWTQMVLLTVGVWLILLLLTVVGLVWISRRPILALLHGSRAGRKPAPNAQKTLTETTIPPAIRKAQDERQKPQLQSTATAHPQKRNGAFLRFMRRHLLRSWARSILAAVVAAAFVFGLGFLHYSITQNEERIVELYNVVKIRGKIIQKDQSLLYPDGVVVYGSVVKKLLDSGYVTDVILEAHNETRLYDPICKTALMTDPQFSIATDTPAACELVKSGIVTLRYGDGYSEETVFGPCESGEAIPVLFTEQILQDTSLQIGDEAKLELRDGTVTSCIVAGTMSKSIGVGSVMMSLSAYLSAASDPGAMKYSRIEFAIDPAKNQVLDVFREDIEQEMRLRRGQLLPESALVLDDSELQAAVEPLERSNQLLRILYPVVVAVSVLAAAGLAAMLILQCARETAILRVLGSTRRRTMLLLLVEQIVLCVLGLLMGLGLTALILRPDAALWRQSLLCAGLYLVGCLTAAVSCAALTTRKNPLELLQVKE